MKDKKQQKKEPYRHMMIVTEEGTPLSVSEETLSKLQNEQRPRQPYEEQKKRVVSRAMSRLWGDD